MNNMINIHYNNINRVHCRGKPDMDGGWEHYFDTARCLSSLLIPGKIRHKRGNFLDPYPG